MTRSSSTKTQLVNDASFDAILSIVTRVLDVPIAVVAHVDDPQAWQMTARGLDAAPRETGLFALASQAGGTWVVADAARDDRLRDDAWVTGPPRLCACACAPLVAADGRRLGALCAIDRRSRPFTPAELATLAELATVAGELLVRRASVRDQKILARVSEVTPNAAFVFDTVAQQILWGEHSVEQLLGVERATWRQRIHPDDVERLDRYLLDAGRDLEIIPFRVLAHGATPERAFVARRGVFERDPDGGVRSIIGVVVDVTELRLADERLRASERALADRVLVLEGILQSVGEGILYAARDGELQLANAMAFDLRNHSSATVPDDTFIREAGVFAEDGVTPIAPDQLPLARALRGETVEVQRLFVRNTRFPQGVHVQARARPIVDADGTLRGAVASIADVTTLQNANERSARALANITAITDALPIGLFVRRGDTLLYANEALAQMLERTVDSLVGVPVVDLIDPVDHALVARRLEELHPGAPRRPTELRLRGGAGQVVVEANALRIDYDGEEAILVMCRDVRAEKEARAALDASLREKDALLKEIHHRVKNNLAVVASLLFIQSRSSRDPVLRDALEQSMGRVRSIALVHEQLYRSKDLGRIELGAYLRTLVEETASALGGHQRGIVVELRTQPTAVQLDEAMPCGMLVNELLANAFKHAFPERTGTVVVDVHEEDGRVHVSVMDDGVGFTPEQAAASSGLGLELVREMCVQLGATWALSSTNGVSFSLSFARKP